MLVKHCNVTINALSDDKMLDLFKFKGFADDESIQSGTNGEI